MEIKHQKAANKRERFANEYLVDFNSRKAAERAGFSVKTSRQIGANMLCDPRVKARICELIEERAQRTMITQDRVLLEVARLAFNDPRRIFDENGNIKPILAWPDDVAAAVSSIKVSEEKQDEDTGVISQIKEIKFWDKGKQIELAAKYLGLLIERREVTGPNGTPLSFILQDIDGKTHGLPNINEISDD